METLTVREAAALTGLSAHTLRYYERIGLLQPVARNASGHRQYARADLEHLQFLHCLRATGMPIRRMQEFAALARAGHAPVGAGLELLESHRRAVEARIAEFERAPSIIDAKLRGMGIFALCGIRFGRHARLSILGSVKRLSRVTAIHPDAGTDGRRPTRPPDPH